MFGLHPPGGGVLTASGEERYRRKVLDKHSSEQVKLFEKYFPLPSLLPIMDAWTAAEIYAQYQWYCKNSLRCPARLGQQAVDEALAELVKAGLAEQAKTD